MYRSNEEGNWPCIYDLRDPHVQRLEPASEVPEDRRGVAELQPLPLGTIRDAVVVVRLPVPVMLLFDGVHGRNYLVVTRVSDGDGARESLAACKTL